MTSPTLPDSVSTLLDSLISNLTLSASQGGFGWETSDVNSFVTDITSSSVLLNQLSGMQLAGWTYTTAIGDQSATNPYAAIPTTTLSSEYIDALAVPADGKAANLTAVIAYEAGHAEDPQLNTIEYSGTDLQYGAWIALDLLSEGKSLLNNEAVAQQESSTTIPILGTPGPTTVFGAASSEGLYGQSGLGYGLLVTDYWKDYVTDDLTKTGYFNLPSIELTCPPEIYNAFAGININLAAGLTFSQPGEGTTSMVITFGTGPISSYEIDFGGYGDVAPSAPYFTPPSFTGTSPAPPSLTTYQEFTFTNGDILKEEYVFNSGTMISSTQASETLIVNGTFAGIHAGGSLDTLIDMSGTSSLLDNAGYSSVTEEALNGTAGVSNVFSVSGGTNLLIGDLGNNTFNLTGDVPYTTNIVYGGGGKSTYNFDYGAGTIDILYTPSPPTPQELENLSASLFQADKNLPNSITYIIDPGPNDVISWDDPVGPFGTGYSEAILSGVYSATQIVSATAPNTAQDAADNVFRDTDGENAINFGNGTIGIGGVGNWNGTAFDYELFKNFSFSIENFVQGDLGFTFSGDAERFPYLYNTVNTIPDGIPPASAYGDIAGDIYSYNEKEYVNVGAYGGTIGNGFDDFGPGDEGNALNIAAGGLAAVFAGGATSGDIVQSGGTEIVFSGGTATGTTVSSGGTLIDLLGTITGSVVQAGGQVISSGVVFSQSTGFSFYPSLANGLTLTSGTTEYVLPGGSATATTISSGTQIVLSGGIAVGGMVGSGGTQTVSSGGVASATTVSSGGSVFLASGVDFGSYVLNGATETVLFGGNATATTIGIGGEEVVSSGGAATNAVVSLGGVEAVSSGGATVGTNVLNGGAEIVWSGGSATSTTVSSGGALIVFPGGFATGTTILAGGQVVSTGIVVSQTLMGFSVLPSTLTAFTPGSGSYVYVLPGGIANSTTLNEYAQQIVLSGGIASNVADVGGLETILSGGIGSGGSVASGSEVVSSGGTICAATVSGYGNLYVSAGGTTSGMNIIDYGTESISGGTAYGTTVLSYGKQNVYSGGTASGAILSGGGMDNISAGGTAAGTVIMNGGNEFDYGTVISAVVSSGGTENVNFSGSAVGVIVSAGGQALVSIGGTISGATIAGGTVIVSSGGTLTGNILFVGSSGQLALAVNPPSGATVSGFTIGDQIDLTSIAYVTGAVVAVNSSTDKLTLTDGGNTYQLQLAGSFANSVFLAATDGISGTDITVTSAGPSGVVLFTPSSGSSNLGTSVSNVVVSSGGIETILSGGLASATRVLSGGTENVSSGGTASGAIVSSGGAEVIYAAGTAASTTVLSGGAQIVLSGGSAVGAILSSGGKQIVSSGGKATSTMVTGAASETISAAGVASSTTVSSGGVQIILSGGAAVGTTLASSGVQAISSGGMATSTAIGTGGTQDVYGGGTAISTSDMGGQIILSGGTASGLSVSNGGVNGVLVFSGGVVSGGTVLAGTNENISSGGKAIGVTVSGAGLEVTSGGVASNSVLISGSHLDVSGGAVSGTSVGIGSTENLSAGAVAISSFVNSGGTQNVRSGGTAASAIISSGGIQAISAGGSASLTSIKTGTETVYAGGTATSTSDIGGQIILSGGTAVGLTVSNGGVNGVLVYSGGIASGGTVLAGTNENISSGGRAIGVTVSGAGLEVTAGGVASNSVLVSGSHLDVTSGTVSATSVGISSTENLSAGANASGSVVISGGNENVLSGGMATSTTVSSGGRQIVSSGGKVSGTTISGGGSEIVQSGATMSGSINFAGSNATLSFGGTVLPTNVVSGFDAGSTTADDIVLTSYTYSSSDSATLGSSNVLTLHLNGTISTLHFNTSQSFAGEYFAVQENSQDQVVIVDPPISASTDRAEADFFDTSSGLEYHRLSTALRFFADSKQMVFLPNFGSAASEAGAHGTDLFGPKLPNQASIKFFSPQMLKMFDDINSANPTYSLPTSAHVAGGLDGEIINRSLQSGPQHGIFVHSAFG